MRRAIAWTLLTLAAGALFGQDDEPGDAPEFEGGRAFLSLDTGGHVGPVRGLAFTPDGQRLVSCGDDQTVQVWDVATGRRLKVFRPPTSSSVGRLRGLAMDPGGKSVAVVGDGCFENFDPKRRITNRAFVLDLETGRVAPLAAPAGKGQLRDIAVSADGRRAFSGTAGIGVHVFARPDARPLTAKGGVTALAFSPDGKRLATTSGEAKPGRLSVYEVGKKLTPAEERPSFARTRCVAWVGAERIVVGHAPLGERSAVTVWTPDGKAVTSLAPEALHPRFAKAAVGVSGVHPTRDGKVIVVARWQQDKTCQTSVSTFDPDSGRVAELSVYAGTKPLPPERPDLAPSALSADGAWLAVAAAPAGPIRLIDLKNPASARWLGRESALQGTLGWHKDAATPTIAWKTVGSKRIEHGLDLMRMESREVKPIDIRGRVLKDGKWSLDLSGKLRVSDGATVVPIQEPFWMAHATLGVNATAPWVACADGTEVTVYSAATGKRTHTCRPAFQAGTLTPSPDGHWLLAGDSDLIRLYRVTGAAHGWLDPVLTVYPVGEDWIAWTREGYYAATPGGEKLMGWTVFESTTQCGTFHPAARFRRKLHRPDLIGKLMEAGGVTTALKALGEKAVGPVAELLPPAVEIVEVTGDPLKRLTVKVRAAARSKAQPVTSLRLMINGRPVPGQVLEVKGEASVTHAFEVELPPGRHHLSVLARSPDATGLSDEVTRFRVGQRTARLASLFIGINDYKDPSLKLNAAVPDAEALAAAVAKHAGPPLFDKVDRPLLVRNREATKKGILDALADLRKRGLGGNDLAVIGFAGHGVRVGREFYLMPVEATEADVEKKGVSGSELRAALKDWPCQVLVLLDACHAGAGGKAILKGAAATDTAAVDLADDETGAIVLCAAMGHQQALETAGANPRGLFSHAVEKALAADTGVPHSRRDRSVFLHHLEAFVIDEVMEKSGDKQHPFLYKPDGVESIPLVSYRGK